METLKFRSRHGYKAFASGIEVPVSLAVSSGEEVSLIAKVDTGATFCIFRREHAEALGLNVESGLLQSILTSTGRFDTFGHMVRLSCYSFEFESMVFFASQLNFRCDVLGLQGWVDRLRFGLVHHENALFLSYYND